jgi:mannan endo-1,4-beta-mannosidase
MSIETIRNAPEGKLIMKRMQLLFFVLVFLISACAAPQARPAQSTPADSAASKEARTVLAYLAALSNDTKPGVIVGQNTGHGSQILDESGTIGYAALVGALQQQTGELPGMIGLDYEQERIYSADELLAANQIIIQYWKKGGLVTINWSPLNPWLNDEMDITNHPGSWTDTRNMNSNLKDVDLRQLIDPKSSIYPVWRRKLDRVAAALLNLQKAGVVVLWRPMQEMNGNWFWWGNASYANDPGPYVALWADMFYYFKDVKGLHNLLWVYSPNAGPANILEQTSIKPVGWSYPGDGLVDIVAGTAYNDALDIKDYETYRAFGKPLGMAEFGPTISGQTSLTGTFKTTLYAARLQKDYPAIAYWVSWHNWNASQSLEEHQAIVSNQDAQTLMQNPAVLTLKRIERFTAPVSKQSHGADAP